MAHCPGRVRTKKTQPFSANLWYKSHTSRTPPAIFAGAPTVGVSHPKKEPQAYLETTVCESVPGSACLGCLGCDQGGLQCASFCFCAWVCVCVLSRSQLALLVVCELSRHFSPRGRLPSHRVTQADTRKGKDTKWKKQQIEFGISWSAAALIEGVKAEQRSLFLNSADVF